MADSLRAVGEPFEENQATSDKRLVPCLSILKGGDRRCSPETVEPHWPPDLLFLLVEEAAIFTRRGGGGAKE